MVQQPSAGSNARMLSECRLGRFRPLPLHSDQPGRRTNGRFDKVNHPSGMEIQWTTVSSMGVSSGPTVSSALHSMSTTAWILAG